MKQLPGLGPVLLGLGGIFIISTCIKVLLIPAYRSTDFDVHRNWLAITHSLPLSRWYYDETSQWTLDYPPLFAWFEWLLSQPAPLLDPLIVDLNATDYASPACVLYQRFTVILSDLLLLYPLHQYYCYQVSRPDAQHRLQAVQKSLVVATFLLLNYGLLLVDHIHFQYNGFLFGFLLLSIVRILQGRHLEGGFWFAVLLNLKHIFLYLAPAYFIFLLKHYCYGGGGGGGSPAGKSKSKAQHFLPQNFMKLGGVVAGVFLLSFGPFIWLGQLGQVLSRLFPFKRGLCHAYWAPNFWALYSFADTLASAIGERLGVPSGVCDSEGCGVSDGGTMTSGLVGEMGFRVLPNIAPWFTLLVTLLSMMPALLKVWFSSSSRSGHEFVKVLVLCAYSSFLFGWHVHEKAVLLITIPMSFVAVEEMQFRNVFIFLCMAAHVSLFPLLHQPAETLIKLSMFVMSASITVYSLPSTPVAVASTEPSSAAKSTSDSTTPQQHQAPPETPDPAESPPQLQLKGKGGLFRFQSLYMSLLLLLQVYCIFLHGFGPLKRLEFLPLLLTSVTCAGAIIFSWGHFLCLYFQNNDS